MLAHRGLAVSEVENTAGAFAAAIEAGSLYIETDAHVTADGVAVLWHDPNLLRFGNRRERIDQLTWSQLREFRYRDAQILSLAEALERFPEARFNIDLKVERAIEPVATAIEAADARGRTLLTSFSDARRLRAAERLPGVATSVGMAAVARMVASGRPFASPRQRTTRITEALAGAVAVQIPRRRYGIPVLSRSLLESVHAAGAEVHVWTINDPSEMRELLAMGVDGVVSDRADLAVEVVNAAQN